MDGGDLEVLALTKTTIAFKSIPRACAGCGSAMGGTLFYIEDQLKNNVYYNIVVEPEDPFASYPPLTDEESQKL
jgi:NifU-like protein